MPQRNQLYSPSLSFRKAKTSYFIHDNEVHAVAECSAETFKAAVGIIASKQWQANATHASLLERGDITDKWYLLLSLAEAGTPLKLYASKAEAERALNRP